jgi:Skp family chaperone for outer membrane proteins
MNKYILIFLTFLLTSVGTFAEEQVQTQPVKSLSVGFVNFQQVIAESNLGKDYMKNAKKSVEKKQKLLQKLEDQVRKMKESFEKQRLVLDDKVREQKAEELAYKIKELQRKSEDFQAELKIADARFQKEILSKVMKEVKIVAEQLGYSIVLSNSTPGLMFFEERLDITDRILERINN